ncbi:MAG: Tex family protein [Eubacteriales bacterium]|nr:Tex family protein [Eubacteriales bacterium]
MATIEQLLSEEFKQTRNHVQNVIQLIDAGNTIPFIARYRKEMTGSMDDQLLRALADRLTYLRNMDARRNEIKTAIAAQEKLTEALTLKIDDAETLAQLEDIYRPFRPKRRTRASIAAERGLMGLAARLIEQDRSADPLTLAAAFIDPAKEVPTAESALAGARDIIAERIADDADLRCEIKQLADKRAVLHCVAAKEEDSVYALYYDFTEPLSSLPSHRILAINRGEKEGYLKASVDIPRPHALTILTDATVRNGGACAQQVRMAAEDGYDRLMQPSLSRELRAALTDKADEQAIKTFALNLKPLLMQPPVKNKITLGVDPAYRTGCKLAVVDGTGKVLDTGVIYPTPPHNKKEEAANKVKALINQHGVETISIGNGTASRESEQFIAETIHGTDIRYAIVSEAGASVYSASKLAAEEFPDYDVSLRSAISIARRLQDPLAELVKIDPKSIGIGQYQHDMPQQRLDETLSGVVEDCVNAVGVDLNTASVSLLSRVSGLGEAVSKRIVAYREENGMFHSRKELMKVQKLGARTFEQCAGFLRVAESKEPLDNTGVHPESYTAAKKLLQLCGYTMQDMENGLLSELPARMKAYGAQKLAEAVGVGLPTLNDIARDLMKPGRDPRDELPPPLLRADVMEIADLRPGMELTGTVRNVVDFGAFVDIGVHQDGLVHISRMAKRFIRHPSEAVKTGDVVKVWVLDVDSKKQRISLTMLPDAISDGQ